MQNEIIKVGTFFTGIGSPEKALQQLKEEKVIKDFKVEFFSEIDKFAIKSYCAIHDIDENLNLGDITKINGQDLPYCDLWIGGFPCQDISNAGKQRGFDLESSTRSSLGWEMIRLLKEVKEKPKYVIFENVAAIKSKKFKSTLDLFKKDLEKIGYKLYDEVLSAFNYDIPQNRKRYFLLAILDHNKSFQFEQGNPTNKVLKDFLEDYVDDRFYFTYTFDLDNGKHLIYGKNNHVYDLNIDNYYKGKKCGTDLNVKFNQSARIFSEYGYAPTLTANNTADNCKVLIKGDNIYENKENNS